MQPLGRKPVQIPNGKHKVKERGKNKKGWWENIASEDKKYFRQSAKKDIDLEIDIVDDNCYPYEYNNYMGIQDDQQAARTNTGI